MIGAAHRLRSEHSLSGLLKGGHGKGETIIDVYRAKDNDIEILFENKRIPTKNSHGTGCTLSSAIAAFTGRGESPVNAIRFAEEYLHKAIAAGARFSLGKGHGPVHHFFDYRQ
jgi:hydroxymethylpyrimidine/phosphomethylpyrimidine kinase